MRIEDNIQSGKDRFSFVYFELNLMQPVFSFFPANLQL